MQCAITKGSQEATGCKLCVQQLMCGIRLSAQEFDALLPGFGDEAAMTQRYVIERGRLQRLRADVLRMTNL